MYDTASSHTLHAVQENRMNFNKNFGPMRQKTLKIPTMAVFYLSYFALGLCFYVLSRAICSICAGVSLYPRKIQAFAIPYRA